MLTPEEELRVASCIDAARAHLEGKLFDGLSDKTSLWLAEKLKEVNEELKAKETWCVHNCGQEGES